MGLRWIYWVVIVVYFLSPVDLVPDAVPGLGRLDDILLVIFAFVVFDRGRSLASFFREARQQGRRQQFSSESPPVEPPPAPRDPYQVLGLQPGADQDAVRRAYRRCISKYHPDKFAHLGPEFEQTARIKTDEIISAYERLKR